MADAYIFDLDGTLLDTEVLWVAATEEFLRDRAVPIRHERAVEIVYGRSWHDVYGALRALHPVLDMPLPQMQAAMDPYYRRLRDRQDVRIHSSIALLKRLALRAPVCIVSGSSAQDVAHAVDLMDIREDLAFALASEDYRPGKPHPACYRMAAERLGVRPEACVVFEDSAAGVRAAKAAGMRCVALVREGVPEQDVSDADLVLSDLAQFRE